jgi:hypothetical protein
MYLCNNISDSLRVNLFFVIFLSYRARLKSKNNSIKSNVEFLILIFRNVNLSQPYFTKMKNNLDFKFETSVLYYVQRVIQYNDFTLKKYSKRRKRRDT